MLCVYNFAKELTIRDSCLKTPGEASFAEDAGAAVGVEAPFEVEEKIEAGKRLDAAEAEEDGGEVARSFLVEVEGLFEKLSVDLVAAYLESAVYPKVGLGTPAAVATCAGVGKTGLQASGEKVERPVFHLEVGQ